MHRSMASESLFELELELCRLLRPVGQLRLELFALRVCELLVLVGGDRVEPESFLGFCHGISEHGELGAGFREACVQGRVCGIKARGGSRGLDDAGLQGDDLSWGKSMAKLLQKVPGDKGALAMQCPGVRIARWRRGLQQERRNLLPAQVFGLRASRFPDQKL